MRMGSRATAARLAVGSLVALTLSFGTARGAASPVAPANEGVQKGVVVTDLCDLGDGGIGGVIVNHTATTVRDVNVAVEERWLWSDERHPGTDNPGRTTFARYRGEIPPGGRQCFVFHPDPPRPARSDGRFEIDVQVSTYTQLFAAAAPPDAAHASIVTPAEHEGTR